MVVLEESRSSSRGEILLPSLWSIEWFQQLWTRAWLGWAFVYASVLLFCFVSRCVALTALIKMYGTGKDCTFSAKTAALCVGILEDFVCATYFACVIWLIDILLQKFARYVDSIETPTSNKLKSIMLKIFVFASSWMLFVAAVGPVAADLLLVRLREVRFTFQVISSDENSVIDGMTSKEMKDVCMTVTTTAIVAALFAILRTFTSWPKLSRWNPIHAIVTLVNRRKEQRFQSVSTKSSSGGAEYDDNEEIMLELDESGKNSGISTPSNLSFCALATDAPYPSSKHQESKDVLYRRGELAFDVDVTADNPPNVLVIVVESFRYHDSRYLVGDDDPSNLFKGSNTTITPNFDKWAKRGVAFTNFWSSWRTSRSVESLLFAQLPYDDVEDSGMTGGKTNVELAGLPQLFKAKGYEPFFTTGCQTEYDDWNSFLPSHGFDTVWSRDEMMKIAEHDLNISSDDWYGDAHRGLYWGVHDDLSFQILGDLLINKTQEQRERAARGEAKKPLFLTHYTISSHIPFQERPQWYAEAEKPDFSALYDGEEYTYLVKDYLEMRYFTDMELGKFMDRMAEEGILNDTIVIISGDHGQAPEYGYDKPEVRALSATRVAGALIAEGRLGEFVGLKFDDAAEQYDILNTLADITGIPEEGFLQDGVGRSLKRKVEFGERVVFSNNPSHKLSVVRGNKRLQYDRHSNEVLLHDTHTDHDMKKDQFPTLNSDEQDKWFTWRKNGRWLNSYYTTRWDNKCLLAGECSA
ncbi:voltage-gated potassium channel subunit beta [Phytophthora nicotianae]|uniref:Voltage-gated potassium channel subunit beta n=1 Tax=Phytophthora nicotianae TaxID=4792 RepID=A0A0W8DBA9_PHYNI|nr:voltage-gated potassium channel subunit beta [Phytophthora nicotianae]